MNVEELSSLEDVNKTVFVSKLIILNCFKHNFGFQSDVSAWNKSEMHWLGNLKERD